MAKKRNTSKSEKRVNPHALQNALRNLKSRFATDDIKSMKEVSGAYATGMPFALDMSYDTMIKRFHNPEQLTLNDILITSDITETEVEIIIKVAIAEARKSHIKRDISHLLPKNED
ncbi:hypothetical protein ACK8HY_09515 [Sphingobacterium sp. NGMCC 1.201703]|uniref:hypothetical protein n=1 Tax=Sphingobacterium sp. NGMCC 1.201703 TaxID=3388657 RepID=UPI0039FDCD61